ncbi:MAG: hypothetical protein QHH09_03510 [Microgenomates group bacterium]|nr:hypothetical protein [Microgenomates group bacterium]
MKTGKKFFFSFLVLIFLLILTIPSLAEENLGVVLGVGKKEVNQVSANEKKTLVGEVEKITGNSIIINEKKDNKKTEVILDQATEIVGSNKKNLPINNIKIKDKIAVVSSDSALFKENQNQIRKVIRIYLQPASASAQMKRLAIQGVITNINGSIITLAHQIQRSRIYTINTNDQTQIVIKDVNNPTINNLSAGQRIIVIADKTQTEIFLAKRIHVVPGQATGIFERLPVTPLPPLISVSPSISTEEAEITPEEAAPTATLFPQLSTETPSSTTVGDTPTAKP